MKRSLLVLLAYASVAVAACNSGAAPDPAPKADPAAAATVAVTGASPRSMAAGQQQGACGGGEACGGERATPGSCGEAANAPDTPAVTTTDPVSGAPMYVVGAKLSGLPVVKVADLIAKPDDYAGKTIRVEGDVSAMCTHRRGWFTVQDAGDKSGTYVRILTAPSFLVPPGSIGKKARAEGRVEVIDVDPGSARHYAQDHRLPGQDVDGVPNKTVVIRAIGAEFI